MAIGGVVIQFALDTAQAVRDLGKFTRAAGDVDDDLKKVDRALDTSERSFDSLADEVDQTLARIKTDMSGVGGAVDGAAVDVNASTGRMRSDLNTAGRETGAEFVANIAEGIGSGEASLSGVVQGTLGGLTNLAASLAGPVGIAAGVAAGAIGLVFANVKKEAEEAQARLETLRAALEGITDYTSKEAEAAIFDSWVESALKVEGQVEAVAGVIEQAGITAEEFAGALAGDPADLETVNDKLHGRVEKLGEQKRKTDDLTAAEEAYLDDVSLVYDAIADTGGELGRVKSEQKAISSLTQDTEDDVKDWDRSLGDVEATTGRIKSNLDGIDGREINVKVKYTGKPPPGSGVGGALHTAPTAGTYAAPSTVTLNVHGAGLPTTSRELVALLESHQVRMGRRRGQPRAVAW